MTWWPASVFDSRDCVTRGCPHEAQHLSEMCPRCKLADDRAQGVRAAVSGVTRIDVIRDLMTVPPRRFGGAA